MSASHYDVLNVTPRCSLNEIKRAYRRSALLYHPDKNSSPEATVMLSRVQEAYGVLSDGQKKAEYDSYLKKKHIQFRMGADKRPKKHVKRNDPATEGKKQMERHQEREAFNDEAFLLFERLETPPPTVSDAYEPVPYEKWSELSADQLTEEWAKRINHILDVAESRQFVTKEELEKEELLVDRVLGL